jgi:hypothetical protein
MTQINKKRNRHVVRKLVVPVKSRLRNSIKNGIGGENVWFM